MLRMRAQQPDDTEMRGVSALQDVAPAIPANGTGAALPAGPPARLGWLALWMSGTLTAFIAAALSVRTLSNTLSPFEMMSIRSLGGLVILFTMALISPDLRRSVRPHRMGLQTLRNLAHFGSQLCWTIAITALPLATVFSLEFTIPAWVALLAVLVLGERMTTVRAGALAICFVGVLVILRPGLQPFQPAALSMVLGALLFAIAAVITKKLVVTEATFSIMVWMNLMQLPLNLAGSDPLSFLKLSPSMALPLLGLASAGLAIHYCLANAFRYGDATIVIPMDFLRVPLIAIIGWMLYGERLDAFVFAGAGLIIAGVLWNLHGEARRSSRLATMQPAE